MNLKSYKQSNCFHWMISSVKIIAYKQIICIWWCATNSKQFHEIVKFPMHISTVTRHRTTCTLDSFVRISLAFSWRLLTWDSDSCLHLFSCSIHWSALWWAPSRPWCHPPEPRSFCAATCTWATSTSRRRFPGYLCRYWRLLSTSTGLLACPSVLGHQPLPSSTCSSPRALHSVTAAAGVVTSRPASGGGGMRRSRRTRTGAAELEVSYYMIKVWG